MAHGFLYPFENKEKTIEEILSNTKIDGAECEYPLFTEKERMIIKSLCKKYNKFMSAGSDYHAKNKPNVYMATGINNNISVDNSFIEDWINIDGLKIL